ncbi:MAG: hypothetical protein ACI9S9_003453 [Planctomycetota bacterium]|jgi:hypothetical protein
MSNTDSNSSSNAQIDPLMRARSFGWWALLCWLTLGIALEAMHGFKVGWYLDVDNEGRKLQLTLAHTHGTLLAVINIIFALSFSSGTSGSGTNATLARAAKFLKWAAILMPLGFLGGGIMSMGADPGFAIVLVPIGGLLLFAGVLFAARAASSPSGGSDSDGVAGDAVRKPAASKPAGNKGK